MTHLKSSGPSALLLVQDSAMAAIKEPPLVLGVLSGISYVSGIDYYKVCWRTLICAAITPICELSHHHYSFPKLVLQGFTRFYNNYRLTPTPPLLITLHMDITYGMGKGNQ